MGMCEWLVCAQRAHTRKRARGYRYVNMAATMLFLVLESVAAVPSVCTHLCEPVCSSNNRTCVEACAERCHGAKNRTRPGLLSPWITFTGAIQHVGVTTSDLHRSVLFYTQVMGGVEVKFAGGDGWKGDDVYQLLMQAALLRGGIVSEFAANLSTAGSEVLDARYVAFDNVVMELLDYRSEEARLQRALAHSNVSTFQHHRQGTPSFPMRSPSTVAPSVVGNMHISFNVRPSTDLNDFVAALEKTAHEHSYSEVYCNRVVPVTPGPDGHPNVSRVPREDNSYEVTNGPFEGWSLAYCKGPDGEQLEFNKVTGNATRDFDQALRVYLDGGTNPIW